VPQQVRNKSDRPVLIAGFGSIGRRHFQNLQSLGVDNFVFYRTRQGTLGDDDIARWPSTHDLDKALSHRPGAAVISNPSSKHLEVALAAAAAGCDLFIEKPLSNSLAGCDQLAEVVKRNELVTMIGCQFRFHPLLMRLRSEIAGGRLGTIAGARAEWGEYLPDWHPWEDYRQSYSARAELGGGVILTLIHPLDYLYWMFGPVARVHASTARVPALETPAGEDWAEITFEFQTGTVGQVHLDYIQRPNVHQLSVWGDRGRAVWDYHAGTLVWQSSSGETTTEQAPEGFERNTMFVEAMKHFLECASARRPTSIPLGDGIAVLELALRAKQDAEANQRI